MEELRAPARYMDILGAIAQGKTTLSEIASAAGLRRESATTYLSYLELLGLVDREKPLLGKGGSSIHSQRLLLRFLVQVRVVQPGRARSGA